MKSTYNLPLSFEQIQAIIKQLPDKDKELLKKQLDILEGDSKIHLSDEKIKGLLRSVRSYFISKLGKFTHKKKSEEWYFYGLAFTRKDLGYVFGFNIGFFKPEEVNMYKYAGMNVLITTNKEKPEERKRFLDFFREHLDDWKNQDEDIFSYPGRGDVGKKLARYKLLIDFENEDELIDFYLECIDGINDIYPKIIEAPEIFNRVVRGAPKWTEEIIDICAERLI